MRTSDVDPKDYKYIVATPDASFSPQRNKAIIQETIAETERFFESLSSLHKDDEGNRIDILSSYGVYRLSKNGTKPLKEYLGRQQYNAIIGEKILSKYRALSTIDKLQGRTKVLL